MCKRTALGLGLLLALGAPALAADLPVSLVSITAPVHPGGTVVLIVATRPGAICQGRRQGHFSNAYSIALAPRTAGPDGRVQWSWPVLGGAHPIGLRGVHVDCAAGGDAGALDTSFDVE